MKKWEKSSAQAEALFNDAVPTHPDLNRRKMFGYQASFVKGQFFAGLHEDNVVIRLPDQVKARFPELESAVNFDPMGGRPMTQWWVIPAALRAEVSALRKLLQKAFAEVRKLPGKAAPARKPALRRAK